MPCVFCVVLRLRPHLPSVTSWISLSPSTTPVLLISLLIILISFPCHLFASHQLPVSPVCPLFPVWSSQKVCVKDCLFKPENWSKTLLLLLSWLSAWEVFLCVFPYALPDLNFWIFCVLPFGLWFLIFCVLLFLNFWLTFCKINLSFCTHFLVCNWVFFLQGVTLYLHDCCKCTCPGEKCRGGWWKAVPSRGNALLSIAEAQRTEVG